MPFVFHLCNPDHTHFLVSRSPKMSEEDLATIVAISLQKFIMKIDYVEHNLPGRILLLHFLYQNLIVDKVCKYILNQPNHHRKITFTEEYEMFLKFYQKTLKQNHYIGITRNLSEPLIKPIYLIKMIFLNRYFKLPNSKIGRIR